MTETGGDGRHVLQPGALISADSLRIGRNEPQLLFDFGVGDGRSAACALRSEIRAVIKAKKPIAYAYSAPTETEAEPNLVASWVEVAVSVAVPMPDGVKTPVCVIDPLDADQFTDVL